MERLLEKRAALLAAKAKVEQKLKRATESRHRHQTKQAERTVFPVLEAIEEASGTLQQSSLPLGDLLEVSVDSTDRLWLLLSNSVLRLEEGAFQRVLEGRFGLIHSSEEAALVKCFLSGKHFAIGANAIQCIELPKDYCVLAITAGPQNGLKLVAKHDNSFSISQTNRMGSITEMARHECDHLKIVLGNVLWTHNDEAFMLSLCDMRVLPLSRCLDILAVISLYTDEDTNTVWTLSADSESWQLHKTDKNGTTALTLRPHGLASIDNCGRVVGDAAVFWAFSIADFKLTLYDLATLASHKSFALPSSVCAVSRIIAAGPSSYLVVATENSCKIAIRIG